jgi:hypothetical protein
MRIFWLALLAVFASLTVLVMLGYLELAHYAMKGTWF